MQVLDVLRPRRRETGQRYREAVVLSGGGSLGAVQVGALRALLEEGVQPDLLVARRDDVGDRPISAPLLLAVEVLSPSTRSVDLLLKHGVYAESGVQAYWVVDPLVPSVRAWTLVDGAYVEVGRAEGADALQLDAPFPVRVVPAELLDG